MQENIVHPSCNLRCFRTGVLEVRISKTIALPFGLRESDADFEWGLSADMCVIIVALPSRPPTRQLGIYPSTGVC
jgi:hypothetical protein